MIREPVAHRLRNATLPQLADRFPHQPGFHELGVSLAAEDVGTGYELEDSNHERG